VSNKQQLLFYASDSRAINNIYELISCLINILYMAYTNAYSMKSFICFIMVLIRNLNLINLHGTRSEFVYR